MPLALLTTLLVLLRSALLPTTSLMPGVSGMVSLTVLIPTAIIGRVPSTPMIVGAHTPFGLITPMSPQPTPVVAMTASPYAASLLLLNSTLLISENRNVRDYHSCQSIHYRVS